MTGWLRRGGRLRGPVLGLRFAAGIGRYALTGRTPESAYQSLRELYVRSDGALNRRLGRLAGRLHPPVLLGTVEGALGRVNPERARELARTIARDGYVIFRDRLTPETCRALAAFAATTPATLCPAPPGGPERQVFDPARPLAPRYQFDESQLLGVPAVLRLVTDRSFLAVAQAYLGFLPVNDLVAMWWSVSCGEASSEAAQLYHFDMDRIRFLKFFVYLSDVGPRNGPHCLVRGTHRTKPSALRRDGRIDDAEIAGSFPAAERVELYGPTGTILAVDTMAFHKGQAVERGERLVFQLEYADSLFGASYETHRLTGVPPAIADELGRFPRTYARFRA